MPDNHLQVICTTPPPPPTINRKGKVRRAQLARQENSGKGKQLPGTGLGGGTGGNREDFRAQQVGSETLPLKDITIDSLLDRCTVPMIESKTISWTDSKTVPFIDSNNVQQACSFTEARLFLIQTARLSLQPTARLSLSRHLEYPAILTLWQTARLSLWSWFYDDMMC